MKKQTLLFAALMTAGVAQAQIAASYGFSTGKMDAYTPGARQMVKTADQKIPTNWAYYFADGTIGAENYSSVSGKGFAIGFDFPFAGQNMKYFAVGAGGSVRLSADEEMPVIAGQYLLTNNDAAYDNLVVFGNEYGCTTTQNYQIGYEVIGQAPNRQLVVSYDNYGFSTSSRGSEASDSLSLLIVLNESGTIQFNAKGASKLSKEYNWYGVVRGTGSKDIACMNGAFEGVNHASSAKAKMTTALADDAVLTFEVPQDVVAPTAQPSDLVASNVRSTQFDGTFTSCEADYYLVVISEGALNAAPQGKTAYAAGDELGNGTVVKYSADAKFTANGLKGSTDYTVTVFASNYYGLNGPQYNVTSPLVAQVSTTPEKPGVLAIHDITAESFLLDVAANAAGDQIMVIVNDSTHNPGNYGVRAQHGDLLATYKTGDDIVGGGKVAYFGPAANNVVLDGLKKSLDYYFLAYSYNEKYGFSCPTDTVMAAAMTVIELPWAYTTMQNSLYNAPTGWTTNMAVSGQQNAGTLVHTDPSEYELDARYENHVYVKIAPMHVNQLEAVLSFDMASYTWNRFSNPQYGAYSWLDDDVLKAIIHTAEGDDEVTILDGTSFVEPDSLMLTTYKVDLTKYYDKVIEVELVFDLEGNAVTTIMENFRAEGKDPEITGLEAISAPVAAGSKQFDLMGRESLRAQGLKVKGGQLIFIAQ